MKLVNIISIILCGLSIGWLIGLTTSPVLQTVVSSLLALITALLTTLLGFQGSDNTTVSKIKLGNLYVLPLALFLVSLALSSSFGIYARTNEWLGINPLSFKSKWIVKDKDSSGIILNLYNSLYNSKSVKLSENNTFAAKLFRVSASMVNELKVANNISDIKTILEDISESNIIIKNKLENCSDSLCIMRLRNEVIKAE